MICLLRLRLQQRVMNSTSTTWYTFGLNTKSRARTTPEVVVEDLDEEVDGLEERDLVVVHVDAEREEQPPRYRRLR